MKKCLAKETVYYRDFKEFLLGGAQLYGEQAAITTYSRTGQPSVRSFTQLRDDAFAFAIALEKQGLAGQQIALVAENSYEWLIAYWGIVLSGGVVICIDVEQADDTIGEMLLRADAQSLICSKSLLALCGKLQAANPQIERLIVLNGGQGDYLDFQTLLCPPTAAEVAELTARQLDGKQTAVIIYTSGTTSTAKPVMLSQTAILTNAADSLTILDSRERIFNSLPLYHTYGLTCGVLCGLLRGIQVCLSCDLKRMMQEMTLFKPNLLVAVPLIIEVVHKLIWSLLEQAGSKAKVQKSLKMETTLHKCNFLTSKELKSALAGSCLEQLDVILSGGAYLNQTVAKELLHFGITVLQGYGITECSPSISCNRNEDFSLDSVGQILPSNRLRFVHDEIQVQGAALMNGYYNAPELTAAAFEDGWFKTGDLGYLDKKGHLHISGRQKNLIVMKNGKKVAAEEMENEIRRLPLVKEVMVYGALCGASTDDVKIAAAIYPDPALTARMSNYEILEQLQVDIDEMNTKVPIYKQIQMINLRDTDFDRTSSQKIKRQTGTL